jgi:RNA polymerase sigma factor (sigma-70 family)
MPAFTPSLPTLPDLPFTEADNALAREYQASDPSAFVTLIRTHDRALFHLAHALLRNEVSAENITQQVFARARRRIQRGHHPASITQWLYHATLRFARHYHRQAERRQGVRRTSPDQERQIRDFDLGIFARVIALFPGKIEPRDCELLALRHVLGLSLNDIARLLRIHPYETSNRLIWARERIFKLGGLHPFEALRPFSPLALSA